VNAAQLVEDGQRYLRHLHAMGLVEDVLVTKGQRPGEHLASETILVILAAAQVTHEIIENPLLDPDVGHDDLTRTHHLSLPSPARSQCLGS